MTTPDEHLEVLRRMLAEARAMESLKPVYPIVAGRAKQQADALEWLLNETAYGVTSDEVVG